MYTELIEGIGMIKLYGWELLFKDAIQKVRESEICSEKKYKLSETFQHAIFSFSSFISGFVCFYSLYLINEGKLSTPIILGAMQPIVVMNNSLWNFGNAITLYFFLDVMLKRVAAILNTKNIRL